MRTIAIILSMIVPVLGTAEPMYAAEAGDAVITLYSEPCALAQVANLPRRATWAEKGKVYEGCWSARQDIGLVILYFDDRNIGLAPMQAFQKVTNS